MRQPASVAGRELHASPVLADASRPGGRLST